MRNGKAALLTHGGAGCYNRCMPEFTANGLRLHYEERDDPSGQPLVFIPGLSGSHLTWGLVAKRLSGHRIILFDPRDAGKSDRARAPYAVADVAGDIAVGLEQMGVGPALVTGVSMGGAVAQELAIRRPELVRRLALVATYDADDPRGTMMFEHFAHLRRVLSPEEYARTLIPWIYTYEDLRNGMDVEALVKRLTEDPYLQTPEAYERQMRATVGFRSRDRLDRINCPTLLIFGDDDMFTPMRFARSLHEGIQGSRLAVLAGAGHGLLWTRSAEVAALIDGFAREE